VSELVLAAMLVLLVLLAVVAVQMADLLLATLALGGYGFVMALTWAAIGAADVSFTEAVVGAGATTVFMLAALLRTTRRRSPAPARLRWVALGVCAAVEPVPAQHAEQRRHTRVTESNVGHLVARADQVARRSDQRQQQALVATCEVRKAARSVAVNP